MTSSSAPLDVIENIARRATRFPNEVEVDLVEEVSRKAASPFTDNTNGASNKDVIDDEMDACSDGKLKATNGRKRGRPEPTTYNTTLEEDDLKSRLTGHFNPGSQVVDVSKINPLILNSPTQKTEPKSSEGSTNAAVDSLNARLSQQGRLMEKLMAKIDKMSAEDRRTE